jgi:hypothetical protein
MPDFFSWPDENEEAKFELFGLQEANLTVFHDHEFPTLSSVFMIP